jgi:hypothetical protein
MPIFEGKYTFDGARLFDRSYAEFPALLVHSEYRDIAESFSVNLDRLTSFAELPLQLIYWSARLSVVKHIARYRCDVSPEDGSKDDEPARNSNRSGRLVSARIGERHCLHDWQVGGQFGGAGADCGGMGGSRQILYSCLPGRISTAILGYTSLLYACYQ